MNMIGYAVHLISNTVHPSEAPDVLYMIVSTVHFMQMQYPQVGVLKYSMASAVHLMGNAAHPSETPDVHDGLCSTLNGKSSTLNGVPEVQHVLCNVIDDLCSTPQYCS